MLNQSDDAPNALNDCAGGRKPWFALHNSHTSGAIYVILSATAFAFHQLAGFASAARFQKSTSGVRHARKA
jgi:hypothetical protein